MSVYISAVVKRSPRNRFNHEEVCYLGSDESCDACELLLKHGMMDYVQECGTRPKQYYMVPKWLRQRIVDFGVEQVTLHEFDRRTCQKGGGIPTVQNSLFDDPSKEAGT